MASRRAASFRFAISHLGLLLGKSPVTIRAWERKGLLKLPRVGNNRVLDTDDVRRVARIACESGRITRERMTLINEAMSAVAILEQEKK